VVARALTSMPTPRAPRAQADWSMVKRGWDAHVLGKAPHQFKDALVAVKTLRVRGWPRHGAAHGRVAAVPFAV